MDNSPQAARVNAIRRFSIEAIFGAWCVRDLSGDAHSAGARQLALAPSMGHLPASNPEPV